jgi:endonuclease G
MFDIEAVGVARLGDLPKRKGYSSAFLGGSAVVPLPVIGAKSSVLTFSDERGARTSELTYTNFSVVMSKKRRLCIFSACNVDGDEIPAKAPSRTPWKFDPRIPVTQQIGEEVYGQRKKGDYLFARGHMTRRVDAAWGKEEQAKLGNKDSMFVPNACPQDQSFNGGLWKSLEDKILAAAVADGDRISVFTGPIFNPKDPVFNGVAIPLWYWKLVAWRSGRKLRAVAYMQSQKDIMDANGFVPSVVGLTGVEGQAITIAALSKTANLDFGPLLTADILAKSRTSIIDVYSPQFFVKHILLA